MEMDKAVLRPQLASGELRLPRTSIPAAEGKVRLAGALDLRSPEPVLRMPGNNKVLDGVKITPELGRELLSRINPIFYHLASADGAVNLIVNDLVFPLGETARQESAGEGRLELVDAKVEPSGIMRDLLALGGVATERGLVTMRLRGADFVLHDGRVSYRDFVLIFPEQFDLTFSGSVGLDDTLDLSVSMPVRAELLERLGVRGTAARYAEQLTGSRVDIPLVGTRQQPALDLLRIDKKALIERALKESAGETIDSALKELFRDRRKGKEKPRPRKN